MKRFQRILLTAGLLVSLSGCDAISDPSSDIPEQIAVADSTTESSDAETAEAEHFGCAGHTIFMQRIVKTALLLKAIFIQPSLDSIINC